jgi:hypothetical protein
VAFPNLALRVDPQSPGGTSNAWAEATGIPDNGNNTFTLPFVAAGIDPNLIQADWMRITVTLNGRQLQNGTVLAAGVTDAAFVSLAANKTDLTLTFTQGAPGVGQANVGVELIHTVSRGA